VLETVMNLLILLEHDIVSLAFLNEFLSVNKSQKDVAMPGN